MSDISMLEGRITAALDRIRRGVEARGDTVAADPALHTALEDERAANAELVERVRLLKERQDTQVASLTGRVESQRAQLMALDEELQSLRASNAQMREINTQLRQAVTEGLAPELLNEAVAAEIEALHAQRQADVTEIDIILAELKPLVEETPHATD
jgi:chromosome segregation ATPase